MNNPIVLDRYAVFGNPIAHSLSPLIHQRFAAQTQQAMTYEAILVPKDGFATALRTFCTGGGKGLNITVPFKIEAFKLIDQMSETASTAGSVNTILINAQGKLYGDNTDGVGLVADLARVQINLMHKKVLVIGAGGAVRGILAPLLKLQPTELIVSNRTLAKAEGLAQRFSAFGRIRACAFAQLADDFDIVIHATSANANGEHVSVPEIIFRSKPICYDLFYSKTQTPFLQWAQSLGASMCVDGLGMLVEQAAAAFYLWRGVCPETTPVIDYLRKDVLHIS